MDGDLIEIIQRIRSGLSAFGKLKYVMLNKLPVYLKRKHLMSAV